TLSVSWNSPPTGSTPAPAHRGKAASRSQASYQAAAAARLAKGAGILPPYGGFSRLWSGVAVARGVRHVEGPGMRQHDPVAAAGDHRAVGRAHLDRRALHHRAGFLAQPTPERAPARLVAGRRYAQRRAVVERRMQADRMHGTLMAAGEIV